MGEQLRPSCAASAYKAVISSGVSSWGLLGQNNG